MATKTRTRKQSTKNAAITSLVAMGTAHTVSVMDTDHSFALVPVSGVNTIRETVHNGIIIDSTLVHLESDAVAQTETGPVIIDHEKMADDIARSSVGYMRNAKRAVYARYIVQTACALLDSFNAGQTTHDDGSPVLYRVADVARIVLNVYHHRLATHHAKPLPKPLDLPGMRAMLSDVRDPGHHAKCLIAAGLFNSRDLPAAILWDAARSTPFYALPNSDDMPFLSLIYGDEMGHGGAFNHQLASDFLARLNPSYVTPILYDYVSTLNRMSYTALRKFLRSFLDDSRKNTPITLCYDRARDAALLVLAAPRGMKTPGYLEKLH